MHRRTFKLSSLVLALMGSSVVWAGGRWVSEELCIRENQERLLRYGRPLLDRVLNDGQGEYHVCVFAGALVVTDRLYGERKVERISHGTYAAHMVLRDPNLVEVHFYGNGAEGYEQYQVSPERIELVYGSMWERSDTEGLELRRAGPCGWCSCHSCLTRDWQWSRY